MEQTKTTKTKTECGWTKICRERHDVVARIEAESTIELTRRQARKIMQRRRGER